MYKYTNLPVNAKVRLHYPPSGDSQGQENLLAPIPNKAAPANKPVAMAQSAQTTIPPFQH